MEQIQEKHFGLFLVLQHSQILDFLEKTFSSDVLLSYIENAPRGLKPEVADFKKIVRSFKLL